MAQEACSEPKKNESEIHYKKGELAVLVTFNKSGPNYIKVSRQMVLKAVHETALLVVLQAACLMEVPCH